MVLAMRMLRLSFLLFCFTLLAQPAGAQGLTTPPGAYRTANAYHRHQPQPAGTDAYYPDKRGQVVVEVPHGSRTEKLRVAPDSAWGYVSGKGRASRLYRGEEYRLEHADTLCLYSSTTVLVDGQRVAQPLNSPARYFFSRGLTGLVFPLTPHFLSEAYAASNPGFVALVTDLNLVKSLADFDRKTGLFRVTSLYRQAETAAGH